MNTAWHGLMFAIMMVTASQASLITCRACLDSNDSYDWTKNFGPPVEYENTIQSGAAVTSYNGVKATLSFESGTHNGGRVDQTAQLPGWFGNFKLGDELIDMYNDAPGGSGNGPLTFSFSRRIVAVGANIQADYFGAFTAQLCDSNGSCVSENGVSNSNADGSAIFIGLRDPLGFSGATFSLTACKEDCNDFAINQMDIVTPNPEPSSLLLLSLGCALVVKNVGAKPS